MKLITVNPEKCVGCNACVRNCPAPEANITKQVDGGRFVTTVNFDKCIGCGECVKTCTHGARGYVDDLEEVMELVKQKKPLIVMAAPAIKTTFPKTWKSILNWFKEQGCLVCDVSFGADICTWAHLRLIQQDGSKKLISQPCAAIVRYIELYNPKLAKNISPIHSPMSCMATYLRKYAHRTEPIVALSPCIAKKYEFKETGLIQYNVTFRKLAAYFEEHKMKFDEEYGGNYKYDFDLGQGQLGGIYDPDIDITTSEGVHKVYPELDMYAQLSELDKPQFLDVLSCEFGCNSGAGTVGTSHNIFGIMKVMRGVENEAKSVRKTTGGFFFRGAEDKLFKKFDTDLKLPNFFRSYDVQGESADIPYEKLNEAFDALGKHTEAERNHNCHACGYKSCKEMATAIVRGLNIPDNCIVHAKTMLAEREKEAKEYNEQLAGTMKECHELSAELLKAVESIGSSTDEINSRNKHTGVLTGKVSDFITRLSDIFQTKDSITTEELLSLSSLLSNTSLAFNELDESISTTNSCTDEVHDRVKDVKDLIGNLNTVLSEAIEEEKEVEVWKPTISAPQNPEAGNTMYASVSLPSIKNADEDVLKLAEKLTSATAPVSQIDAETDEDSPNNDDLDWLGGVE